VVGGKKSEELLVSTAVPLLVQLSVRLYVCVTAMYDEWWDVRGDETRRDEVVDPRGTTEGEGERQKTDEKCRAKTHQRLT
jgi:hypothetical protein